MTIQSPPFVLQNSSHSAELVRRETQSELPPGSAGGIVPATAVSTAALTSDLQVTAPVSGMTVLVSSGGAFVSGSLGSGSGYGMGTGYGYPVITTNGTSAPTIAANAHGTVVTLTTQGVYYCYNDNASGKVSLAIASSNPSNPRIDVVGMQVEDAVYSGSNNDWKLAVVTGTAASSPTVPTFPANFLPLSLVWVPAAATNIVSADIIDLRISYNRNPYKFKAGRSSAQSFTTATSTQMAFDTIEYNPDGAFNNSTGTYVVPVSGLYSTFSTVAFNTGATAATSAVLKKNGTGYFQSGGSINPVLSGIIPCNAGDSLGMFFTQNTGGSVSNFADVTATWWAMSLLSPL